MMRRIFFLIVPALLCACGGGGGGYAPSGSGATPTSTPSSTPVAISTPTPSPTPSASPSAAPTPGALDAPARMDAQGALAMLQSMHVVPQYDSVTTLAVGRRAEQRRRDTSPCVSGYETTESGSGSSSVITVETFYDLGCTQPWQNLVWNAGAEGSIDGPYTLTAYSQSDQPELFASGNLRIVTGAGAVVDAFTQTQTSIAATSGGTSIGQIDTACQMTPSVTCGFAAAANLPSGEDAVTATISATVDSVPGGQSISATLSAQTYAANAPNAITVSPGTFPAWSVSGAAAAQTLSGTFAVTLTHTGLPSGLQATLNDAADGDTVSLASAAGGVLAAVNGPSGASSATLAVDFNGNGSILYGDGSRAGVIGWLIEQ